MDCTVGDGYNGFRLRPGAQIDRAGLMAAMEDGLTDAAIKDRLDTYARQNLAVNEALTCLVNATAGIGKAAADLGVQTRSLQRLLQRKTGKSPVFWLRLARVRRTAQRAVQPVGLAELAYDMGYADQPHMTREFRQWLGVTPRQVQRDARWASQHLGRGYGV